MTHEAHTKTVVIRTSRLMALTAILVILSVGSLIVQVATNRDLNDVQSRTKAIQTKVVALCLNSSTLNLCKRQLEETDTQAVVQLCRVVAQELNRTEVSCLPSPPPPRTPQTGQNK